jgi:hypothetical protein
MVKNQGRVKMVRMIVTTLLFISLSTTLLCQEAKQNYNILFTKECSLPDASDILYNAYSNVSGIENITDLKLERIQFNYGKISMHIDDKPNSEQIDKLLKSQNLVSYEIIITKNMYKDYHEVQKNSNKKQIGYSQPKKYQLNLKYNFKTNPQEEINLLTEVFGKNNYEFEKDANELIISIPKNKSESFINGLKNNNKIVYVQAL